MFRTFLLYTVVVTGLVKGMGVTLSEENKICMRDEDIIHIGFKYFFWFLDYVGKEDIRLNDILMQPVLNVTMFNRTKRNVKYANEVFYEHMITFEEKYYELRKENKSSS